MVPPERLHRKGKTHPNCEQHYSLGWGPRLHEEGKRNRTLSFSSLLRLWTQCHQLPQTPPMPSPPSLYEFYPLENCKQVQIFLLLEALARHFIITRKVINTGGERQFYINKKCKALKIHMATIQKCKERSYLNPKSQYLSTADSSLLQRSLDIFIECDDPRLYHVNTQLPQTPQRTKDKTNQLDTPPLGS